MGVPDDVLRSALRFSVSHLNEPAEAAEAGRRVAAVVERLRRETEEDVPVLPRRGTMTVPQDL